MSDELIPESLLCWTNSNAAFDTKLAALMKIYAQAIDCPRCVLFLRQPERHMSRYAYGWWCDERYALVYKNEWTKEGNLAEVDPMYGLAMDDPDAIYIDDIETAPSDLLNVEFERKHFGHRALVHAPVYYQGKFYGILEPCVFDTPRIWSEADRAITTWTQARIGPLAAEYVEANGPLGA